MFVGSLLGDRCDIDHSGPHLPFIWDTEVESMLHQLTHLLEKALLFDWPSGRDAKKDLDPERL